MPDDDAPLFLDDLDLNSPPPGYIQEPPVETEEQVSLEFQPSFKAFPTTGEQQLGYIQVLVRTSAQTSGAEHQPLNICLVLDQSSSMRGEKLFAVKAAARQVVDQLTNADFFSLISFNDRATTVVSCQRVTSRENIKQMIDGIEGKGGTELANGLYAGISEMRPAANYTPLNYLLLLTDGQTYGDADRCVQLGQEASRHKIVIHPMGVGIDWNEDLLETVASRSGGSSEYIESADGIVRIFLQKINQLRGTITQTSTLIFEGHSGTQVKQVYRITPKIEELIVMDGDNGRKEMNLGPLGKGVEYSFLMELILPPGGPGGRRVGNLAVTFAPVGAVNAPRQAEMALGLNFADTGKNLMVDPDVKLVIEKVTAFKLQARAWQDIADGDISSGTKRLKAVSTRLLSLGEVELSQQVQQEVRNLEMRGTASNQGKKRIKYGTRGLTSDLVE